MVTQEANAPVLAAAIKIRTGYLVTFNRRHFINDPGIARRSSVLIGIPGDALSWVYSEIDSTFGQAVSNLEDNFALAYYAGGDKSPKAVPWDTGQPISAHLSDA